MRLDDTDYNVVAILLTGVRLLQHFVGLADAGRGADKDAEFAETLLLAARRFEQGFGRRSIFEIAPLVRHLQSVLNSSAVRPTRRIAGRE
jgi:hypothetical protein